MCVLLGVFREFLVDPYYEPLAWFMIIVILLNAVMLLSQYSLNPKYIPSGAGYLKRTAQTTQDGITFLFNLPQ